MFIIIISCNASQILLFFSNFQKTPKRDMSLYEFCKALKDPSHEEHERYMEWSDGNYDSEGFDAEAVDLELMKYLRWSRDRYQYWRRVE